MSHELLFEKLPALTLIHTGVDNADLPYFARK
jgi:hypothetical protein